MGPVKQLVPVSFAGGIDTKTDPRQVIPGKLLDLQNGVFQQTGAINRRWGYTKLGQGILGTGSTINACKAVDAFNNELLLFDGAQSYSYIQATDNWAARGRVVSLIQSNQQVIAGNSQQLSPDFASLGGVEVYVWEDSRGGLRYSAVDAATGTFLVTDRALYTGALSTDIRPKCIPWQGQIYVFFATAAATINFVRINPANPLAVIPFSNILIAGPLEASVLYDVAATTTQLCIAYSLVNGAGTTFQQIIFTSSLAVSSITTLGTSGSHQRNFKNVVADGNGNFWVLSAAPNGTSVTLNLTRGSDGVSLLSTTPITATLGNVASIAAVPFPSSVGAGFSLQIFVECVGSQTYNNLVQTQSVDQTGATTSPPGALAVFARSVGLASKPFIYTPVGVLVNVAFQSQQQSTYFTLDSTGNVVGKVFAGLCGGLVANSDSMLPECQQISPGIFKYANLIKSVVNTEAGVVLSLLGVNATKLDFVDSNHFLSSTINHGFYTVGGVLQSYDGSQYVEHGFNVYPEAWVATPIASGGSIGTGTFGYAVTYEWNDNNDLTQISTPSIVSFVTFASGTTNSVSLQIPTLRLTKKASVKIVIYRTQANGTLLYRVTSAIAPTYSNPLVDSITFVDTLSDASIAPNGLMYTQPLAVGSNPVVPNSAPPACSLITTFANRLFIAGLDDPYTLWYSQPSTTAAPMQFSSLLQLRSDPDGGPITALVRLDDKLVIFKQNAIFYLTGQGPTPTGDQNDFGAPINIPSGEVGCVNQNALVVTPLGILFQSINGIYLLDRALNVSYKGAPVEKFNSLGISSATLIPNQWVVFTTATGGTAIVYDFYFDQWSTFTNHTAVDSVLYLGNSNLFTFATPSGQVFLQSLTSFNDAGVPIPFYLRTSRLSLAGIQGYQRLYHALLLGQYKGPHTLTISCAFDFDETFTAQAVIPVDATLGTSTFGSASPFGIDSPFGGVSSGQSVYQFRIDILRKCQTISLEIADSQVAPGNEGFSLSSLGLVVGAKKSPFRLPAIKQFGAI